MVKALPADDGAGLCEATVEAVSAYHDGVAADDDESVLVVWRPTA
ncbi:MAG: hypothetical protein P8L66_06480 [Rhodospirillaceae bacterium]|nr:hypothetical protein [Rhodospirillaceae bacterium]